MSWSQQDTSFKKLQNKRITTSTGKGIDEEKGASALELYLPDVKTDLIPGTPPGASTSVLSYTGSIGQTFAVDTSVPGNLTWFATSGYGNTTSANDGSAGSEAQRLGDWISDKYDAFGTVSGAGYEVKVYDKDSNLITKADPSDWLFDYQTGILVFNNASTTYGTVTSTGPFRVVGYRYIGNKGIISASYGGLGYTSYTKGDLLVGAGSTFIKLNVGSNDYVLTADSTTSSGLRWAVSTGGSSGSGITTLNSLTATSQTFEVGTAGNVFNISSIGSSHTFNIPIAGSGSTGLITTLAQTIAGQKTFTSAILGDLTGTATTAGFSNTAGFATTAEYAYQSGYGITAGLATTATYAHQSGYGITAGLATTSTYAYQSGYGITAGLATTATYAYQSGYGITAGLATTATYAYQSGYGITAGLATTATYAYQSGYGITAGLATTATYAYQSGYGITAGFATSAGLATTAEYAYQSGYGITAGLATTATYAYQSGYGITSGLATTATYAYQSGYGITSGLATTATYAYQSGYGITSGLATTATYAYQSGYGITAGLATTATYAYQSGYGITAGLATTATYSYQSGYGITAGFATTAGLATTANYAYQSGYGITSGLATTASNINLVNASSGTFYPILSNTALTTSGIGASVNSLFSFNASTGAFGATSVNLFAGQSYNIGGNSVLSSTSLGTGVTNSSLTAVGIITSGTWAGSTITYVYGGTGFSSYATGDLLVGAGSTLSKIAVGTNNFVLVADSTVAGGIRWANVSGFAITNINGLTASKQDLAFGYSGTVPAFSSSGSTHTLNIPLAGTGSTGLVSTQAQSFAGIKTFTNAVSITDNTGSSSFSSGALVVTGGVGIGGTLNVQGDLNIQGTVTTINSTTVTVADKNIELGVVATPTDLTAEGGGITLRGATNKSINWYSGVGWSSSESLNLSSGNTYKINGSTVLSTSSLGTGVTNSYLTAVGTISTGIWAGTAITALYGGTGLAPTFTVGDILYANTANTWGRLAASSNSGYVLASAGSGATPTYVAPSTLSVGFATTSNYSYQSGYAITSGSATSAGLATTATYAHQSGYATTSGFATTAATINTVATASSDVGFITFSPVNGGSGVALSTNNNLYVVPSDGYLSASWLDAIQIDGINGNITNLTGTAVTATNFYGQLTGNVTGTATTATYAHQSGYAITSGIATTANYAYQSGYGITSGLATTATYAHQSGYAITSGFATTANYAYQSGYAITSGLATTAFNINVANTSTGTFYPVLSNTASSTSGIGASVSSFFSFNASTGAFGATSVNILSGQSYSIGGNSVLSATSLGTGVTNSSLTALGTITTGTWAGSTISGLYGGTGYTTYTKGDILVGAGNTFIKLPVGTDAYILSASSASAIGVSWIANTGGGGAGTIYNGSLYAIPYYPAAGTAITGSTSFTNTGTSINIGYSTAATNNSTGALTVVGGVGIGQSLFTSSSYASSISGVVLNNGVITSGNWAGSTITGFYGGTGYNSYNNGDILVGAGSTFIKVGLGSTNYVLSSSSIFPGGIGWTHVTAVGIGITPPSNEHNADLWWNATDGSLNVYYSDGDTDQWVEIAGGSGIDLSQPVYITSGAASTNTVTGALTVSGGVGIGGTLNVGADLGISGLTTLTYTSEKLNTKTSATGTVSHDLSTGSVFYHSSISNNFTANFTNVPATNDRALGVTLILAQGVTPYMSTALQIDGSAQTIKWVNNTTPTGTASKVDIVGFSLIRTGSAWTVLGQYSTYG